MYYDASLDESGWSPDALGCLLDVSARLPYEEACDVVSKFGLDISNSQLAKLTGKYAECCEQQLAEQLVADGVQSLTIPNPLITCSANATAQLRRWILQLDGVYVLGRPQQGTCPGLEIKTAVLYAQDQPQARWMLASRCSAEELLPQLFGLLHQAPIAAHDELIGLGDGAAWIANCFAMLGAKAITDVYHACEYLDKIMQALGWSEEKRLAERCRWYAGQVNARDWLDQHLFGLAMPTVWDEAAQTALSYFDKRLDSMDYANFTSQNYPIGSGQVEAMNKAVIGHRLKRSGMHWSETGASAMAALRAQTCAAHPLVKFDELRHQAFAPLFKRSSDVASQALIDEPTQQLCSPLALSP